MLATLRPTLFMDSFDPYRHHSDYNSIDRQRPQGHQRSQQLQSAALSQQQPQQQLPSFKEILPPPLHSAIDSTTTGTSNHPASAELSAASKDVGSRPTGSSLPSPNYSQSSSMPDSFDDFGTRHSDTSFQLQSQQRHPSTWTSSPQYNEMASAYTSQRPAYQSHGLSVPRPSPGLPPIRDIGQGLSKYSTNYDTPYLTSNGGYSQGYNQPSSAQHDGNSYPPRRDSQYDFSASRTYGSTYPTAGQHYNMGRDVGGFPRTYTDYSPGYPRQQYHDTYYPAMAMNGTPSPITPGGLIDSSEGRNRRRRGNLPKHITDILRTWFQDHLDHPYPSEEEKQMFIAQTGLTINQISNWFINARRRHLPALRSARDSRTKPEDSLHQTR